MFEKMRKTDCWVAFGLCIILAFILKSSYSTRINDERIKHAAGKDFLPVTATMQTYEKHVKTEYRRHGRRRREYYDITYQYEVKGQIYYKLVTENSSLINSINIYYNPDDPSVSSFFANYQDAVEGLKFAKIFGDVFVFLSVIVGFLAFFRTFIYKTSSQLGGTVIHDDFSSYAVTQETYDDYKRGAYTNNYSIVTNDNLDYINDDNFSDAKIPGPGEKVVVDKVETIAFPGKMSKNEPIVLYTEEELENQKK